MQKSWTPPRRERGAILMLGAFGTVTLLACAGMVLDGGMAYLTRMRLVNAVDGAALAAGHAAQQGSDVQRTARNYLNSAYAKGGTALQPRVEILSLRPVHLRVMAEVRQPLVFMSLFGLRDIPVHAVAEVSTNWTERGAERPAVDLAMVTDMSTSILSTIDTPTRDWYHVVEESQRFFEKLDPQRDRVAQIVYGEGVAQLIQFERGHRFDIDAMRAINYRMRTVFLSLPGVGGNTATGPALAQANAALADIPVKSPAQVLLLLTDGVANQQCLDARGAGEPSPVPCRTFGGPSPAARGAPVVQMLEGVRTALERGTKVLIIGYGRELSDPQAAVEGPDHTVRKTGEQWLRGALEGHDNGMYCRADDPISLQRCYEQYANETLAPSAAAGPLRLIR